MAMRVNEINPAHIYFDSECVSRVIMDGIQIWPGDIYYRPMLEVNLDCYAGKDIRDYCETEVWMLDKNRKPIERYDNAGRTWYEKLSSAHPNVPNTSIRLDAVRNIQEMEDVKYLRIFSTFKQETITSLDVEYDIQYAKSTEDIYKTTKYKTLQKNTITIPRYSKRSIYYDFEVLPDEDLFLRVFTHAADFKNDRPSKLTTRIFVQKKEEE